MSCGCGGKCGPCGLGQYPALPGHAIPYHLTQAEIQTFLAAHSGDEVLRAYLDGAYPPYGVIIKEAYGEFLVWSDQSGVLHVVDVTNMSVARQVEKQMYESPDPGLLENLERSFSELFQAVQGVGVLLGVIALAYVVYKAAS